MRDIFLGFLVIAVMIVATVAGTAYFANAVNQKHCYAQTAGMGLPVQYDMWGGCRIKTKQGWMPLSAYRVVD